MSAHFRRTKRKTIFLRRFNLFILLGRLFRIEAFQKFRPLVRAPKLAEENSGWHRRRKEALTFLFGSLSLRTSAATNQGSNRRAHTDAFAVVFGGKHGWVG